MSEPNTSFSTSTAIEGRILQCLIQSVQRKSKQDISHLTGIQDIAAIHAALKNLVLAGRVAQYNSVGSSGPLTVYSAVESTHTAAVPLANVVSKGDEDDRTRGASQQPPPGEHHVEVDIPSTISREHQFETQGLANQFNSTQRREVAVSSSAAALRQQRLADEHFCKRDLVQTYTGTRDRLQVILKSLGELEGIGKLLIFASDDSIVTYLARILNHLLAGRAGEGNRFATVIRGAADLPIAKDEHCDVVLMAPEQLQFCASNETALRQILRQCAEVCFLTPELWSIEDIKAGRTLIETSLLVRDRVRTTILCGVMLNAEQLIGDLLGTDISSNPTVEKVAHAPTIPIIKGLWGEEALFSEAAAIAADKVLANKRTLIVVPGAWLITEMRNRLEQQLEQSSVKGVVLGLNNLRNEASADICDQFNQGQINALIISYGQDALIPLPADFVIFVGMPHNPASITNCLLNVRSIPHIMLLDLAERVSFFVYSRAVSVSEWAPYIVPVHETDSCSLIKDGKTLRNVPTAYACERFHENALLSAGGSRVRVTSFDFQRRRIAISSELHAFRRTELQARRKFPDYYEQSSKEHKIGRISLGKLTVVQTPNECREFTTKTVVHCTNEGCNTPSPREGRFCQCKSGYLSIERIKVNSKALPCDEPTAKFEVNALRVALHHSATEFEDVSHTLEHALRLAIALGFGIPIDTISGAAREKILYLWDNSNRGAGFSKELFDQFEKIFAIAKLTISQCRCSDSGCAICLQEMFCEYAGGGISKQALANWFSSLDERTDRSARQRDFDQGSTPSSYTRITQSKPPSTLENSLLGQSNSDDDEPSESDTEREERVAEQEELNEDITYLFKSCIGYTAANLERLPGTAESASRAFKKIRARFPVLSKAESVKLLVRAERGDESAKHLLILHNIGLCMRAATKVKWLAEPQGLEFDDLVQIACLGLTRAIEKFDRSRGTLLSTYATWWIRQSISRAIYDLGGLVRFPVHTHESMQKVRKATKQLAVESGRDPTSREIAAFLEVSEEFVLHQQQLMKQYQTASLDVPAITSDLDSVPLYSLLVDERDLPDLEVEKSMVREDVEELLNAVLTEREQEVIRLRFGFDNGQSRTLEEVGQKFGLTRERIRQIEAKALSKLKSPKQYRMLKAMFSDIDLRPEKKTDQPAYQHVAPQPIRPVLSARLALGLDGFNEVSIEEIAALLGEPVEDTKLLVREGIQILGIVLTNKHQVKACEL